MRFELCESRGSQCKTELGRQSYFPTARLRFCQKFFIADEDQPPRPPATAPRGRRLCRTLAGAHRVGPVLVPEEHRPDAAEPQAPRTPHPLTIENATFVAVIFGSIATQQPRTYHWGHICTCSPLFFPSSNLSSYAKKKSEISGAPVS